MNSTRVNVNTESNRWTQTLQNGGSVSHTNGVCTLATGTTANGSALMRFNRPLQTEGLKNETLFEAIVRLSDPAANNVRRWGLYHGTHGAFFELSGSQVGAVLRNNSTDSLTTAAYSQAAGQFALDTKFHHYEIRLVENRLLFLQDLSPIYSIPINVGGVFIDKLLLKMAFETRNTNGAVTNNLMEVRGATILPLKEATRDYYNTTAAETKVLKTCPGELHQITVNKKGLVSATCSIYDNTAASGQLMGVIDLANAAAGAVPYNVEFDTGLTIVTAGSGFDLTVIYS